MIRQFENEDREVYLDYNEEFWNDAKAPTCGKCESIGNELGHMQVCRATGMYTIPEARPCALFRKKTTKR